MQSERTSDRDESGVDAIHQIRNRISFFASLTGFIAFSTAFLFNRPGGMEGVHNSLMFSSYALWNVVLCVATWRKPKRAELWTGLLFGSVFLYMVAETFLFLFVIPSKDASDVRIILTPLLPWIGIVILLAFALYQKRAALIVSVLYTAVLVGIVSSFLATHGHQTDPLLKNALLQTYVFANLGLICVLMMLANVKDIYLQTQLETRRYQEQALSDELTGIPNRRALTRILENEHDRMGRNQIPFGVILLDLDHFKQLNDRHGHDVGDLVLKHTADVLQPCLRTSDWFGRWGGEEFLVVVNAAQAEGLEFFANRLRQALAAGPAPGGVSVTASFGATLARPDDTLERLVKRADKALYQAKQAGRNRVVCAFEAGTPA